MPAIEEKKVKEAAKKVTSGMANTMNKATKFKCSECGLSIPKYPGRYPKFCPNCGAEIGKVKEALGEGVKETQALVGDLMSEMQLRELSESDEAKASAIVNLALERIEQDDVGEDLTASLEETLKELKEARLVRTDDDEKYPAEAFAYVPDGEKPSTWKLRLWESLAEKTTKAQLGRVAATLSPGGLRGQKVKIPKDKLANVRAIIREAYRNLGVKTNEMPRWVKEEKEMRQYVREQGAVLRETAELDSMINRGVVPVRFLVGGFNSNKDKCYSGNAIKDAVNLFEGAKMFADHISEDDRRRNPDDSEPRSVSQWVGTLKNCYVSEKGNACGEAHIIENWLQEKIGNLHKHGDLDKLGVSILGVGAGSTTKNDEGKDAMLVESIVKGRSVDFCAEPGAGGLVGLNESKKESKERERDVDLIDLKSLQEDRPDLVKELREAMIKDSRGELKKMEDSKKELEEKDGEITKLSKERDELKAKVEESDKTKAKAVVQEKIQTIVKEAKLVESVGKRIADKFADLTSEEGLEEKVKEAIKSEQAYLREVAGDKVVTDLGPIDDDKTDTVKARADLKESRKKKYIGEGYEEKQAETMAENFVSSR